MAADSKYSTIGALWNYKNMHAFVHFVNFVNSFNDDEFVDSVDSINHGNHVFLIELFCYTLNYITLIGGFLPIIRTRSVLLMSKMLECYL